MTEHAEKQYGEFEEREDLAPKPSRLLGWSALLASGWLIYELTAQPNLGAAIVCMKFGWEDFKTALWLGRRDTHGGRGLACFWLYLASGLWKVAMMALVTIFLLAFLAGAMADKQGQPQGQQAAPRWLGSVAITMIVGFGLSSLATWFALGLAWLYDIRLWLSSSVHRLRKQDIWPPCDAYSSPLNAAGRILLSSLIVTLVPIAIGLCITLVMANARGGLNWVGFVIIFGGIFALLPNVLLLARDYFNGRVIARTPWECWDSTHPQGGIGWEDNVTWVDKP